MGTAETNLRLGWGILLDIATLGLTSLRDGLYEEVARGAYERAAEKHYVIVLSIVSEAILAFSLMTFLKKKGTPAKKDKEHNRRFLAFFLLIAAVIFSLQLAQTIYANRAAAHMEQMQRLVAPYITQDQRLILASRFASMHTRKEYVDLLDEMSAIATANGKRVPEMSIY